jgi:trehalose 6-phosphate phosphatase
MNDPRANCAFFLDIDGTVAEFADTPALVRFAPDFPHLVRRLCRSADGAVAVISGRSLRDIDRILPIAGLPAAGQHGLERRTATGRIWRYAPSPRLNRARLVLASVVERHPRLLFEDKGLSLALHYRRVPRLAGFAHRIARELQRDLGRRYHVHPGKFVVELAPAGRDKGAAIASFMREPPFRGRSPVFVGDDVTDEYGFAVVNRLGGWSVKVGRGPTAATWRLPDVPSVLRWLNSGSPAPSPNRR